MTSNEINRDEYKQILTEVKQVVLDTQMRFVTEATRTSMDMYWQLGQLLASVAARYQWGKNILGRLSSDLKSALDNARGYSEQNLRHMRQFYLEYEKTPELFEIARNVSWRNNVAIMSRIKEEEARRYYLTLAAETLCSRDVLLLQIESGAYERSLLQDKQHNFDRTLPEVLAAKAENAMKAAYLVEVTEPFAGSSQLLERQIEMDMVNRIKNSIIELGQGFAFMGNQYPISVGGKRYYIDLLFFNRILRSLVPVELKARAFEPEFTGKMNLYLGVLDDTVRLPDENPSIGLILCTRKNSVEVDYALRDINKPMGVADLKLSKVLPSNLSDILPDPEKLKQEIESEIGSADEQDGDIPKDEGGQV